MKAQEAYQLLRDLGAADHLLRHAEIVSLVAEQIITSLERFHIPLDKNFILCGSILHDAGKTIYPEELFQSGNKHEYAGEQLLIQHQIPPEIARCCVSHSQWQEAQSTEELVVALADILWKSKRDSELEEHFIQDIVQKAGSNYWNSFLLLDATFEEIANGANARLYPK